MSFNFISAVTIYGDFGAQENKICLVSSAHWNSRLLPQSLKDCSINLCLLFFFFCSAYRVIINIFLNIKFREKALTNWCFWTVAFEETLESPLHCKEIKPVSPKGNQSWFIGMTDAEAEAPILWPPDVKNWLIGKDPAADKVEDKRRRGGRRWDG